MWITKNLHIDQLLVGQNVFEIRNVFNAEAELGGIGIIGENIYNAGRKREHHVTRHLHLATRFIAAPENEDLLILLSNLTKRTNLKKAWIISWKAIASGIVSLMPMVNGEGPREPSPTPAVLNSKLPTLSALAIVAGDTRPARICSDRREGGRGMAIELFGVGICRWILLMLAAEAGADEMSPTSEKISPRSA